MGELKTVGIILAAGRSTGLYPSSVSIPEPLLQVYDKPAIFYSISSMIRMGINNIAIICPPKYHEEYLDTLVRYDIGNLFITIIPAKNKGKRGVLQDLYNAKSFCSGADKIVLSFPDDIFVGEDYNDIINEFSQPSDQFKSIITHSYNLEKFGVISGPEGNIIEKPTGMQANLDTRISTGMYYYPDNKIFFLLEFLKI